MLNLILPKSNFLVDCSIEVQELISPLKPFGIEAFSHTRIYDDGTFIDIGNTAAETEAFYLDKSDPLYKYYTPDVDPSSLKGEYFLCSALGQDDKAMSSLRSIFNKDHYIVFSKRRANYYELFHFGAHKDNNGIINFYINNVDLFEKFIYYFKSAGQEIIKRHEQDKFIREFEGGCPLLEQIQRNKEKEEFINELEIKRYYFDNSKTGYLTQREVDCLKLYSLGKTSDEVALLMSISKRTAETHLENIKLKMDCYKLGSLIRKAIKLHLISD